MSARFGLYIHYPFCRSKCPYCDFASFAGESEEERLAYWELIEQELALWMERRPELRERELHSIYFGGGTPSLAAPQSIQSILQGIRSQFNLANNIEVTLEANPESSDVARFRDFRCAGVNRLSIGVQSWQDHDLRQLHRAHTAAEAEAALQAARDAGYTNLAADLIFGIPGQTRKAFQRNLDKMLGMHPQHISVYGLTLYEGTEFHRWHELGKLHVPSNELQAAMFLDARHALMQAGYEQYEISNYALPDYYSRHNSLYWTGGEWLGLGVSAHSSLFGERWANPPILGQWKQSVMAGELPAQREEMPQGQAAIGEAIMLGLRQSAGVSLNAIAAEFGEHAAACCEAVFAPMIEEGLVEARGKVLVLSERGLLVADAIIQRFF